MSETSLAAIQALAPAPAPKNVEELAQSINLNDPALTITYGTQTMNDIASFADNLLGRVRAKDAGPVGDTLTDLMVQVKDLDLEEVAGGKKGFLENLPLVGSLFNSAERSIARFKTLAAQVDVISGKLDEAMLGLLRDIEVLEQLYELNKSFHQDLSLYIEAGKTRLEQARAVDLPRMKEEADTTQDSMAAQGVRDFAERLNRFERRLHDLRLSRTITLQTAPQIRLIQSNNQTLAEKIQTSVLATIPIWKSQMVLALSLHGQQNAAKLQQQVADTTNELLRKNAEMLESATVDTARQVERSVVDVETLRGVHARLLSTIEETLRIAQEGKERRASVEKDLESMEQDLRTRLTALAADKNRQIMEHAAGTEAAEPLAAKTESSALPPAGSGQA